MKEARVERERFAECVKRVAEEYKKLALEVSETVDALKEESSNAEWQPVPVDDKEVVPTDSPEEAK